MPRFLVLFALAVVAFSLSIAGVSGANCRGFREATGRSPICLRIIA